MDLLGKTVPNRYLIGQELLARIAFQEKKKVVLFKQNPGT
jgi:hypothetical protein